MENKIKNRLKHTFAMFVALSSLVGCGSDSDSKDVSPIVVQPPRGLPDCGQYPIMDRAYKTHIETLIQDDLGNLCYIIREFEQEEKKSVFFASDWRYRLECVDPNHKALQCYSAKEGNILKDVVFAEDGTLILAELDALPKTDDRVQGFQLTLQRRSMIGDVLDNARLIDEPAARELMWYDLDESREGITKHISDTLLYGDDIPFLVSSSQVKLLWQNQSVHVLTNAYGLKYYRFDQDLDLQQDVYLVPASPMMWNYSSESEYKADMAVSSAGKVVVSANLDWEKSLYFNDAFGHSFQVEKGNTDQLLLVFDDNIAPEPLLVGDSQEVENIVGIEFIDGRIWIVANSLIEKSNAAGGSADWDVVLMLVDPITQKTDEYFVFHQDQEDVAYDANVYDQNTILITGANGYAQADTYSQVSNGQGFNWLVNAAGEITQSEVVTGARDTFANAAHVANGVIRYSKVFDGPITHTCDYDPEGTMCFDKAAIEFSTLSEP